MLKTFRKLINKNFKNYPKTMQRRFFATNHKDIGSLYLFFSFYAGVILFLLFIIVKTEFPVTHCLNINNMLIFLSQVLLIFFFKNLLFFKIFFKTKKIFKFLKNNVFSFIFYYFESAIWIPLKKYFQKFWYGDPVLPTYEVDISQNQSREELSESSCEDLIEDLIKSLREDSRKDLIEELSESSHENLRETKINFKVYNIWSESSGEEFSDDWSDEFPDFFLTVSQLHDPIRSGFLAEYYIEHAPKVLIAANYLTEC